MKRLPYVTIVGRPNVGKSTLFNRIIREKKAIVHDQPGVTRDRLYGHAVWDDYHFGLIDTAGLILDENEDIFATDILENAEIGMEEGDVVLFMVDAKTGLLADDYAIADILRRKKKKVIVVQNKSEKKVDFENYYELYELGFEHVMPVSAEYGTGYNELMRKVIDMLPKKVEEYDEDDSVINIAIIGRPNVGKSTLLNAFLGEKRSVVSDVAGTTRDFIDAEFSRNKQKYRIVDTAGIRRKSRIKEDLESYMVMRALKSVDSADVAIFLIDGLEGFTEQDEKICGYAHERGISIILAVNKWDAVEKDDKTYKKKEEEIRNMAPFLNYAPLFFISAKEKKNLFKLIDTAKEIYDINSQKIPTGQLNRFLEELVMRRPHPIKKRKNVKIKYVVQKGVRPPQFIFFTNYPELIHFSYERFLKNEFRKKYGFRGSDIKFEFRKSAKTNRFDNKRR